MVDKQIKTLLLSNVRNQMSLDIDVSDDELNGIIAKTVSDYCRNHSIRLEERFSLSKELFDSIRGFDVIQTYLNDSTVSEIMINGIDRIFIEKNGEIIRCNESFESIEKLEDLIQKMASVSNRTITDADPIVDTRLKDGSRVCAVLSQPSVGTPIVAIRKFSSKVMEMEDLISNGTISKEAAEFLTEIVLSGYNCLISGGTSSGKTTFLNALINTVGRDKQTRVITIEDSAELRITQIENLVSLETRNANSSGCREITIRDLIKTSLRLRPDRIIIGEIRGAEAMDMLMCLNTGHDGSMCTVHSNSAKDTLSRLEVMVLMAEPLPLPAIRRMIASGIDILVHLEKCRDGVRHVTEIVEIDGVCDNEIMLNPIYTSKEQNGKYELIKTGSLKNKNKWNKYHEKERII